MKSTGRWLLVGKIQTGCLKSASTKQCEGVTSWHVSLVPTTEVLMYIYLRQTFIRSIHKKEHL
jgi:hypothetical protein